MRTLIFLSTLFASFLLVTNLSAQQPKLEWAKQMGGTADDYGQAVTTDANGNVYTAGRFGGVVDFDPGAGTSSFTSKGRNDIFILKLSQSATVGITENTFTENIQVYPNPTSGSFAIKFETVQEHYLFGYYPFQVKPLKLVHSRILILFSWN